MYKLTLENEKKHRLIFNQMGSAFTITNIQGLNPPKATINTSASALTDGARFNSSKVEMRTILLAFALEYSAEYNRTVVYDVIKVKRPIRLYYQSTYRDVFIDGYVESIQIDYFNKKQIATVSILCPAPYLKGAQEMVNELSVLVKAFHFPFASTAEKELVMGYNRAIVNVSLRNDGDVEAGMTIELYAKKAVTNPKLYNYLTGQYIGLNIEMQVADLITITTERGHKTVTLLRNGVYSNIFNTVMEGSTWLQLDIGNTELVYEVEEGQISNLLVTVSYHNLYEGV